MEPFKTLTSLAAPLDRTNVDTDQIIPKQFLKRIERTGYGDFLFFDWRQRPDGTPVADFVINARSSRPLLPTSFSPTPARTALFSCVWAKKT
jgi:3-isopropylmalate dehydratase small subunit